MPDFGSFRGFGEKLAQGQTPTQLGKIGSETFGFDVDAFAFFNRVTTAGGSLSNTEKDAVNKLVIDMKAYGIWSAMKAVYPMVGASADACKQNLKSSSFTGTFSTGWTFASTGVTPNGTSAYFDTTLIPNTSLTLTSGHLSFYCRTDSNTGIYDMGTITGSTQQNLITRYIDNNFYACYGLDAQVGLVANTSSLGFFVTNRNSTTNVTGYKNGTQVINRTQSSSLSLSSVYISAANSGGIPASYSNRQCAFSSIGDGLTDTQASNFYTAVQAFNTTLSRQV